MEPSSSRSGKVSAEWQLVQTLKNFHFDSLGEGFLLCKTFLETVNHGQLAFSVVPEIDVGIKKTLRPQTVSFADRMHVGAIASTSISRLAVDLLAPKNYRTSTS